MCKFKFNRFLNFKFLLASFYSTSKVYELNWEESATINLLVELSKVRQCSLQINTKLENTELSRNYCTKTENTSERDVWCSVICKIAVSFMFLITYLIWVLSSSDVFST